MKWSKNFLHLTWTENTHIYIFLYLKKYILTLSNEKAKKQKPRAISTSNIQTIVFEYHFTLKETRAAWRNGWFQGWSKCCTKWARNILSHQEPKNKTKQKNLAKTSRVCAKYLGPNLNRPPTVQRWPKVGTSVTNETGWSRSEMLKSMSSNWHSQNQTRQQ